MFTKTIQTLALAGPMIGGGLFAHADSEQRIQFSGYEWTVKSSDKMGPGPNAWSPSNVRVDSRGRLHLKITHTEKGWQCAEIRSVKRFGFGIYQFEVENSAGRFDRNVVLGLFNYPTSDVGPDGTNEIDIEIARWGQAAAPAGNFTVWPGKAGEPHGSKTFEMPDPAVRCGYAFRWEANLAAFEALLQPEGKPMQTLCQWFYRPEKPLQRIGQKPEAVLLNLWLFQGKPPADGMPVEVIISKFTFKAVS